MKIVNNEKNNINLTDNLQKDKSNVRLKFIIKNFICLNIILKILNCLMDIT